MSGQVLDVLPVSVSGEPLSPSFRMGAWCRLKAMPSTRRARELSRLLQPEEATDPVARFRQLPDSWRPEVPA